MKYVVFFQRPYYPSVVGEFASEVEAEAAAGEAMREAASENGSALATVYVAEIKSAVSFKTDY